MTDFEKFIDSKPMSYTKIDLERMPKAFLSISNNFNIPKIIHVVGTNGKGTTGRFIAEMLQKNGLKVGHYTSPHISEINERFWKDGEIISNSNLDKAYQYLNIYLSADFQKSLTYFEYTTLMNLPIYNNYDWLVLEAGLGGEFDATNVFRKELSVFTPIGFDHQNFLGNTISKIASTKLRSLENIAVISQQKYDEVYKILDEIRLEKGSKIYKVQKENNISFLEENFNTAKKCIEVLGFPNFHFNILDFNRPFGRFQKIAKNIVIDVGHNTLSAERVVQNMQKPFTLIYNSLDDKPSFEIIKIFKDSINRVEIIKIYDERALPKDILEKNLNDLKVNFKDFEKISHNENYLVFGSFKVVEQFLKISNITDDLNIYKTTKK